MTAQLFYTTVCDIHFVRGCAVFVFRCPALLLTVCCSLALASAASAAPPPDVHIEGLLTNASAVDLTVPTADPCVFGDVRVFASDPNAPYLPSTASASVASYNACFGSFITILTTPSVPLSDSDFVVGPAYDSADLSATLPGFDSATQSTTQIRLQVHWASTGGPSDSTAQVTGTVRAGAMSFDLDDSIFWNPWGIGPFPQAGLWACRFPPHMRSGAGFCIGGG